MPHLRTVSNAEIEAGAGLAGYAAYDAAGKQLGDIHGVIVDGATARVYYLLVDTGATLGRGQYLVPVGAVQSIDDAGRRIVVRGLSLRALKSGAYPVYDGRRLQDGAAFAAHERDIARIYQPDRDPAALVDYRQELYRRPEQGAERLQLLEGRLRVNSRTEQAGVVSAGRRVIEQPAAVDVVLAEEEVIIERRPVVGDAVPGAVIGDGEVVEVPVMRERARVGKDTAVAEEVLIYKQPVEGTDPVRETMSREWPAGDDLHGLGAEDTPSMSADDRDRDTEIRPEDADEKEPEDGETGLPLSEEAVAAGTAIIGERTYEYTYAAMGGYRPGEPPAVGVPVVTIDGDVLGTVGEVAEDRFKVAAPLAADYWLPNSAVTGMAPGGDLVVAAHKGDVHHAAVPPPERR